MIAYHATTKVAWAEIQREGVLWGRKDVFSRGRRLSRVTWFTYTLEDVKTFAGPRIPQNDLVILAVKFPSLGAANGHWQFTCYDPISLDRVNPV